MLKKETVCSICGGSLANKGRLTHAQLLTPEQAQAHFLQASIDLLNAEAKYKEKK